MNAPTDLANKVGYVCIFSHTVDAAAANLKRLITNGEGGFDEGVETWRQWLRVLIQSDLRRLNWAGARFSETEWRQILEKVTLQLEERGR